MTKLFVYGSLRKGCFNHHYLEGIAEYKGLFYVKGNNFTLTNQKYPALILSDQNLEGKPEDFTIGELYELSDKSSDLDKVFKDMDEMEGYYGENVEKNSKLLKMLHEKIYSRKLLELVESAEGLDICAKSSGAGGGDCGIAISFNRNDTEKLLERWESRGIELLYKSEL